MGCTLQPRHFGHHWDEGKTVVENLAIEWPSPQPPAEGDAQGAANVSTGDLWAFDDGVVCEVTDVTDHFVYYNAVPDDGIPRWREPADFVRRGVRTRRLASQPDPEIARLTARVQELEEILAIAREALPSKDQITFLKGLALSASITEREASRVRRVIDGCNFTRAARAATPQAAEKEAAKAGEVKA